MTETNCWNWNVSRFRFPTRRTAVLRSLASCGLRL